MSFQLLSLQLLNNIYSIINGCQPVIFLFPGHDLERFTFFINFHSVYNIYMQLWFVCVCVYEKTICILFIILLKFLMRVCQNLIFLFKSLTFPYMYFCKHSLQCNRRVVFINIHIKHFFENHDSQTNVKLKKCEIQ